jgi:hypothetical protein
MESTADFIWIGTLNNFGQGRPGKVCQWDGISAQITKEYELNNAQAAMAIAIDPEFDNPYVMDSNGVLSSWNGSGFSEVGRLPFPFSKLPSNVAYTDAERFIHFNGMYFTKNGTLRCLINNRATNGNVVENMPSGVWEWSKEKGFVHVQSFSYNPVGSSTITDFGQNRVARVGALVSMNIPTTANVDGTFMAGATIYTNASSNISAIFIDNSKDDVQKKGYLVSDWFESDEIQDEWEKWWITFRKLLDSNDSIVGKYRFYEDAPTYFDITWVDTTSFTTSTDLSAYAPGATGYDGTYGGEVEIMRGTGGGCTAHITNITGSGPYTVTIDQAATGVTTGTASARAQNWRKLLPVITPTTEPNVLGFTWAKLTIEASETRIQVKLAATFTGAGEIYKNKIISESNIKIE